MKKYIAILLSFMLVFSQAAAGLGQNSYAATAALGAFEVAGWNFSAAPAAGTDTVPATSGVYQGDSKLQLYLKNLKQIPVGTTRLYYGSSHLSTQGFDAGVDQSYWLFKTSTVGMQNLSMNFSMRSSGTGPRDFDMQWSLDGATNWTHFGTGNGTTTFPVVNPNGVATLFSGNLPDAAKNQTDLYIRLVSKSTSNSTTPTAGTTSAGGVNGINGVSIKGDYMPGFAVAASPVSGAVMPLNSTVNLSFATAGSVIHYTVNGGAEQVSSSNSVDVLVPAFDQAGNKAVISAYATNGSNTSKTFTFNYTQSTTAMVVSKPGAGAIDSSKPIVLTCATPGSVIHYTLTTNVGNVNGTETIGAPLDYAGPLTVAYEKYPIKISASATTTNYRDSAPLVYAFTAKKPAGGEKNYYGQIHAHTAENSDGQGTLDEAYDYGKNHAKLDFMILTDHSNSFDTKPANDSVDVYNLTTYNNDNVKWQNGINTAAKYNKENEFTAGYAYEMTWSGGPGHMNTFNTTGVVSRNNTVLNNKTGDAGLKAYYDLLKKTPGSISQFNHPGPTFGNFSNFNYYDPTIDERVDLLEVGNGEGGVGTGGYFRSIDQYILALDKGWHVAPTNNQDNHKKLWGDANTCRTVVYTNDFSLAGMYAAFAERSVWATENVNLDVVYTLNNEKLGTILDDVPAKADIVVTAKNKATGDADSMIKKVMLISNGGAVVDSADYNSNDVTYQKTITAPQPGYYFVEVVDAAGRYAITAPVWLGATVKVGITSVANSAVMPVTTEPLKLTTAFYNNEATDATLKSVSYTVDTDPSANKTVTPNKTITANGGAATDEFMYTPNVVGDTTVNISAVISVGGVDKTVISSITFKVADITKVTFCGVDGSHGGEYVTGGSYPNSMGNMMQVAAKNGVRVVQFATSQELINACKDPRYKMIILSAPSRKSVAAWPTATNYTPAEIDAIKAFSEEGNTLIFTTIADFAENNSKGVTTDNLTHMSGLQNNVLSSIGSSLRISDDEVMDEVKNGGQPYRLYATEFNKDNALLTGLVDGQVYSQYSGATVYVADNSTATATYTGDAVSTTTGSAISPIVFGFPTTYSAECDNDNFGFPTKTPFSYVPVKIGTTNYTTDKGLENPNLYIPKYTNGTVQEKMLAASEMVRHANGKTSLVIVSGGVFMSNFEIQVTMDNSTTLPYANTTIMNNLFAGINPKVITSIKDVKNGKPGDEFTIEAVATSDVYNGTDTNKGFFDCIYAQDATGGINVFPVASGVLKGQRIQVTGKLDAYQGEIELKVTSVKVIDPTIKEITPTTLSTLDAMAPSNVGTLVKTQGTVSHIVKDTTTGDVSQFDLNDGSGPATVFINGYITKGTKLTGVEEGATVSAIGAASVGEVSGTSDFKSRLRVRDRGEIVVVTPAPPMVDMPTASLAEGFYTSPQAITLSCKTTDSALYFTLDGTDPTTASNKYNAPINLSGSATLKVIAVVPGYTNSKIATLVYTIQIPGKSQSPTASKLSGVYTQPFDVELAAATTSSAIYYTMDGSEPTTASNVYNSSLHVDQTSVIKVMVVTPGCTNSEVVCFSYTIRLVQMQSPVASLVSGTYSGSQSVVLSSPVVGNTIYYTLDGSNPTTASTLYKSAILVDKSMIIKAFVMAPNFVNSNVETFSYSINAPSPTNGNTTTSGSSSSGSSGSSGSSSSKSTPDSVPSPIVLNPIAIPEGPINTTSTATNPATSAPATSPEPEAFKAKLNKQGVAVVSVNLDALKDDLALAKTNKIKTLEIEVQTPAKAQLIRVEITQEVLKATKLNGIKTLKVSNPVADISLDSKLLGSLQNTNNGMFVITVKKVNPTLLSKAASQTVGNNPVYQLDITNGGKKIRTQNAGVSMTVPYKPVKGQVGSKVTVFVMDTKGKPVAVKNAVYDKKTGTATFNIN